MTIQTTITFMFHEVFSVLWQELGFCLSSPLFFFTIWSAWMVKFVRWQLLLLLAIKTRTVHLEEIWGYKSISYSQRILRVSFSWTHSGLYIYHMLWPNFRLLHNSHAITFPTQLCLVLHSIYTCLLHSIIMGFTISFASPHNLCFLFFSVLSIFLFWYNCFKCWYFVLLPKIPFFCFVIYPLFSHDQVILCVISVDA